MKKYLFLLLLTNILIFFQAFSQDTISVFFEIGKSKIAVSEFEKLNNIPTKYENIDIDSILYIGRADSVGNYKSNLKLSERRTRNVAEYLKKKLPETIVVKSIPLGESIKFEKDKNRRVDIIIYFQKEAETVEKNQIKQIEETKNCYYIDYDLLNQCLKKTEKIKDKTYITLESTLPFLKKDKSHYFGSENNAGDFIEKKVKWTAKNTGYFWWKKTRFCTSILKKDYEKYKIFTISEAPCDTCNIDFKSKNFELKEDSSLKIDHFLMQNIQFRYKLFKTKKIEIRTPRDYINIDEDYYYMSDPLSLIKWETKKGRNKKQYYFATLPIIDDHVLNIGRKMLYCKYNKHIPFFSNKYLKCLLISSNMGEWKLASEIGTYYQIKTFIHYAGFSIDYEQEKHRFNLVTGLDFDLNFYNSLRYQFNFINFPISLKNPTWKSANNYKSSSNYGRIYLGSDLNSRFSKKEQFLDQTFYLGFVAIKELKRKTSLRLFFNYGVNVSYLKNYSKQVFPFTQVGLNFTFPRH